MVNKLAWTCAQWNQTTPPCDHGRIDHYELQMVREEFYVSRIPFVSTRNIELFYLRLMILKRQIN